MTRATRGGVRGHQVSRALAVNRMAESSVPRAVCRRTCARARGGVYVGGEARSQVHGSGRGGARLLLLKALSLISQR